MFIIAGCPGGGSSGGSGGDSSPECRWTATAPGGRVEGSCVFVEADGVGEDCGGIAGSRAQTVSSVISVPITPAVQT